MTKKVGKVVQRKKPIKGSRKRVLKKLVNYLKTDCYLFAPFISPSSESSIRGVEQRESPGKSSKSLLKKMEEYLKSDFYMYGPCVIPPSSAATSKGSVGYIKRVTLTTSTSIVDAKERQLFEEPSKEGTSPNPSEFISSDRQTLVHKETVKHMIHDKCRSSSLPDEEKLDSSIRKIRKLESRIRKIAVD